MKDANVNAETKRDWSTTDHIIEKWLAQRHQLIVQFKELCDLKPFHATKLTKNNLDSFCSALVDYVSAGQFEVFEIIAKAGHDTKHSGPKLNKNLMVSLLQTTMYALDFNDRYTNTLDFSKLERDLSSLGEQFALRLEYEEQLIQLYNDATNWLNLREEEPIIRL
jgi:regulator of sigma D